MVCSNDEHLGSNVTPRKQCNPWEAIKPLGSNVIPGGLGTRMVVGLTPYL